MDDDDLDVSYNDYIDDLLDENESMSFATRATRWLTALTVCGWPPVKGGADVSLVRVLPSTLGGSGVFARRSIGANVTVGEYPGVRRSLADYLAKCERTGGRTEVYSLMCRDGWVLDPTGASGVLGTGVGVDDDSYGMDDDSYSYGRTARARRRPRYVWVGSGVYFLVRCLGTPRWRCATSRATLIWIRWLGLEPRTWGCRSWRPGRRWCSRCGTSRRVRSCCGTTARATIGSTISIS